MTTPEARLRDHLRALPQPSPPPALGDRIGRAQGARVRRIRAGAVATALALACVSAAPLLLRGPPPALPSSAQAPGLDQRTLADVRALDRALQTAYERNASDEELAPLWAARARLLDPSSSPADI